MFCIFNHVYTTSTIYMLRSKNLEKNNNKIFNLITFNAEEEKLWKNGKKREIFFHQQKFGK